MEKFFYDDNIIIPVILTAILLLLFMATVFILFFRFARKKIIEKELEKANLKLLHQKKILQASIETQERERKRIAQDLHDAISAKLNVVNLHTNMLLESSLDLNEQSDSLRKILSITTKVLDSSRQISHNLLPPILEKFGLVAAIEEVLQEFKTTKKIQISSIINYDGEFSKNEELHIFRIIQELLNNAIKHGNASNIQISMHSLPNTVIVFRDNGVGFDVNKAFSKKGLGLKNIESRVAILNGLLTVNSKEDNGSSFRIVIKK